MPKVLFTEIVDPSGPDLLRQAGYDCIISNRNEAEIEQEIKTADAIITKIYELPTSLLETAKKLKVISKHGVGYDNIPVKWCKQHGIAVTITPGANSQAVAEHTIMFMLALAKKLKIVTKGYKEIGFAAKNIPPGMEIFGKILGVIGFGHIGSKVAKMGSALGMRVIAYDPYVNQMPVGIEKITDKEELVKNADVITLHSIMNEETYNIIGEKEFALMKESAFLINCGRGHLVDEPSLIRALQERKLAGAALDVTWEEPCNPDSPLFSMDNVLLTPHYASVTKESAVKVCTAAAQNIIDVLSGKKPEGLL